MLRYRLSAIAAGVVASIALGGCGADPLPARSETRLDVVAAFYPLVYAAEAVGGDLVTVDNLTAPGIEPHDLELSADEVRALSEADLIIYLGGGFQPALEDFVSGVEPGQKVDVFEGIEVAEDDDPHVWLDPTIMTTVVDHVAARMIEIDPRRATIYERNATMVSRDLSALDELFRQRLRDCGTRDIVTSHSAFGYLAARYDLNQVSISGIDPEAEPSPGRMAEVARFVREHDVQTIFFEELVSPDVAKTIAQETGATTAMLSPLESAPSSGDYVDAMEGNLAILTKALSCD